MGNCLYQSLRLGDLTNNNYKGNLVQVIDIDIRHRIYLEEGVLLTLNSVDCGMSDLVGYYIIF